MTIKRTKAIDNLIQKIENYKTLDNNILKKIAISEDIQPNELYYYAQFKHNLSESYGRMPVYKADKFSIYVMSWLPGDFTAIHSHGHSDWGIVINYGKTSHRVYSLENNYLKLIQKSTLPVGHIETIKGDFIHTMGNFNENPFLSLHIYGSNSYKGIATEDSKIFDLENKTIRKSFGPAFIDMKNKYYKSGIEKFKTNKETIKDFQIISKKFKTRNSNILLNKPFS